VNKRVLSYLTAGMLLFGGAAGLGTWYAKAAQGAVNQPAPAIVQQETTNQEPAYAASIKVTGQQDKINEAQDKHENEAQESAALKAQAKITPEQARAEALKVVNGEVQKVSLDNENGNLVYSVEMKTAGGTVDVKVDAGDGKVLAQDKGRDNEGAQEAEKDSGPDNDNVQCEQ